MACVFCDIVAGTSPADIVRGWSDAIAFVPLNPVTDGHVLVVPRQHVTSAGAHPQVAAQTMERAATLASRSGEGYNIITSAGSAATQTVFHLHLHIVPREFGDGLALPWSV